MKKTLLTTIIIILALTGFSQDRKLEIAETMNERLNRYLNKAMVEEYMNNDTVMYEQATKDFMTEYSIALDNYRNAVNTSTGSIDYDSLITDIEQRMQVLENRFSTAELMQTREYVKMQINLERYQEMTGETYPEWVQPTGAHDAYQEGDKVSWEGKNWESTIDANVWEPGVSGWREIE